MPAEPGRGRELPHADQRRGRQVGCGQGGYGLLEVLIAVFLTGMVVLALAGGLLTLLRGTAATNERQRLQLALANYSESVKSIGYEPCADAAEYRTAHDDADGSWSPSPGSGIVADIAEVTYWKKVVPPGGEGAYVEVCPTIDEGSQLLTLTVRLDDRELTTQIVKAVR